MTYLGFLYTVSSVVVDNVQHRHVVRRERRYTILLLRTVWSLTRPLTEFNNTFGRERDSSCTLKCLFIASAGELDAELQWARSRAADCRRKPLSGKRDRSDFLHALLDSERERRETFMTKHKGHDKICSLSQDPNFTAAMSTTEVLHTMVRNVHLQWSDIEGRWLTARELFVGQTFPAYNDCLRWAQEGRKTLQPLCSLNTSRVSLNLPPRSRYHLAHQAGNSQTTNLVGGFLLFLLSFTEPPKSGVPVPLACPISQGHARKRRASGLALWREARSKTRNIPDDTTTDVSGSVSCPSSDDAASSSLSRTLSNDSSMSSSLMHVSIVSQRPAVVSMTSMRDASALAAFATARKRFRNSNK